MGLQPNREFGKTALFSIFGAGSSSKSTNCKSGADEGDDTSCHMSYPWELQHIYQFTAVLITEDAKATTLGGSVTDLTTQARTVIGDITVSSARGYRGLIGRLRLMNSLNSLSTARPSHISEILFFHPVGYRRGASTLKSLNINSRCNPKFYSNNKYIVQILNYYYLIAHLLMQPKDLTRRNNAKRTLKVIGIV
jgi:hypothetical protein